MICFIQAPAQHHQVFEPPEMLPLPKARKIVIPTPPKHVVASPFQTFKTEPSQQIDALHIATFNSANGTMPRSIQLVRHVGDLELPVVKEAREPVGKSNNPLNFRTYGLGQGLSSLNIHGGTVDASGNLWLSTGFGGISRYDGKSFAHYSENQGLSNNMVLGLLIDDQERIWCGTLHGLSIIDGQHITMIYDKDGLPGNTIFEMVQDPHGYVWISSYESLARIDPATFEIVHFRIHPPSKSDIIRNLVIAPDSTLWIGGDYAPAYIKIRGSKEQPSYELYHLQVPGPKYRQGDIKLDASDRIWMAFGLDVLQLTKKSDHQFDAIRFTQRQGLTGSHIDCLVFDQQERLWIGTRAGLVLMSANQDGAYTQYRRLTEKDGLPNDYIMSLFTDAFNNVWIGCNDAGLTRYRTNAFQSLTTNDGLPSNRVSSIMEDRQGRIWFGTLDNGIARYNEASDGNLPYYEYFTEHNGLISNQVYALLEDTKGDIWIGLRSGGLLRYTGSANGQEKFLLYKEGIPGELVSDIMMDRDSNLWFTSQALSLESGSGVFRFDKDQLLFLGVDQGLASDDIWCMAQDTEGTFWFGSWGAGITVYRFPVAPANVPTVEHFTAEHQLGGNLVRAILTDQKGRIWVGGVGSEGLTKFSAGDWASERFTTADGLSDNSIMSILEDQQGHIWFGGYDGLSLFKDGQFTSFTAADGFQGIGCLTNAIYQTCDERIWVGTYDRLTVFHPDDVTRSDVAPELQLTNIKLFNEPIDWSQSEYRLSDGSVITGYQYDSLTPWQRIPVNLKLQHANNFIQFDFVGISFDEYSRVKYQHRLAGLEDQWSQPAKESTASYANLGPGHYVFEVRAKLGNSQWGTPLQYPFRIRPPWWLSWWAYVSYFALFVTGTLAFVRLRVQREIQKYKAIEALRLKISSDLHDDVGTTLAGLAMQSEFMAKQPRSSSQQELTELSQLSRSAMDQMRDIVWALDSRRDKYQNLLDRIREFAQKSTENSDFGFHMDTTNVPLDGFIPPDMRQHIYLIVKEAITNSLKHSGGNRIDLVIRHHNHHLIVSISDNGQALRQNPGEGLGVSNMKMRAQKMKASLMIDQTSGYKIELNIPLI
jgi:ligand-binding sensor domain-containing protein/signal transduction histidine kinase